MLSAHIFFRSVKSREVNRKGEWLTFSFFKGEVREKVCSKERGRKLRFDCSWQRTSLNPLSCSFSVLKQDFPSEEGKEGFLSLLLYRLLFSFSVSFGKKFHFLFPFLLPKAPLRGDF